MIKTWGGMTSDENAGAARCSFQVRQGVSLAAVSQAASRCLPEGVVTSRSRAAAAARAGVEPWLRTHMSSCTPPVGRGGSSSSVLCRHS